METQESPIADGVPPDFDFSNKSNEANGLDVKFYLKPVLDTAAMEKRDEEERKRAEAENRNPVKSTVPIMVMCEYIRIQERGKKDYVDKPARQFHRDEYPAHYRAFLTNKDVPQGTPLNLLKALTPERVGEYEYLNIKTIEQLASVSDSTLQHLGPGSLDDREKARTFVKATQGHAPSNELKNEVATLRAQLAELLAAKNGANKQAEDAKEPEPDVQARRIRPKKVSEQ